MEQKEFVKILTKAMAEKKLVLGTERTLKLLKGGKLSLVAYSSNAPERLKKEIEAGLGEAKSHPFPGTNVELGELSKRPHRVSIIGVLKE
jgi:large subunit ribosomal protein L30e